MAKARGRTQAGLRNTDFSDRELLFVIHEVEDEHGVAASIDVADALGVPAKGNRSPAGRVSTRLAWMARADYNQLERLDPKEWGRKSNEAIWRITELGFALMQGRVPAAVEHRLDKPGDALLLMRAVAMRAYVHAAPGVATAIRREWLHQAAQRPR